MERSGSDDVIRLLDSVGPSDVGSVGGKAAHLGSLAAAGFPVPEGFVVTARAHRAAIEAAGVAGATGAPGRPRRPQVPDMPEGVRTEVLRAYGRLGGVAVAVRSSGVHEDGARDSFAGMHDTFTDVVGAEALVDGVLDCWASLHTERAAAYRAARGIAEPSGIAVVVQRMVEAEASGVAFTVDPTTGDPDRLLVEAARGAGGVVGGSVQPDTYVVSRRRRRVEAVHRHPERVLGDAEVLEVVELALRVHEHLGAPADIEWAVAGGSVSLLQARPVTAHGSSGSGPAGSGSAGSGGAVPGGGAALLRGLGASAGVATGPARVLAGPDQAHLLEPGEVLVVEMTTPEWVPALRRAAALVTDTGGMTCHAAIVARELGLPCVVGAAGASALLRDGRVVTVDGHAGTVSR